MLKYIMILWLIPIAFLGLACTKQSMTVKESNIQNYTKNIKQNIALSEVIKLEPKTETFFEANTEVKELESQPTVQLPAHNIVVLPLPFMAQAPYANWDMPYQEACEEASILMVQQYFAGRKDLQIPANEADGLILDLIVWEEENNYPVDLTAQEVVQLFQDKFDIKAQAVPFNAELIKQEIKAKRPVIVPAAGRMLGNPYFRQPGPLYHMLVIKGYNFESGEFIVNDPGTKHGESYFYKESVIAAAAHDWNKGDVINGDKLMILFKN